MRNATKGILAALAFLFLTVAAQAADPKQMVITISTDSINQAGFGLAAANAMQDAGIPSTLFLAADAVPFALKEGWQPLFPVAGATPRELIRAFLNKGGKVMICGGFTQAYGVTKKNIVTGINIAMPADLAGALYAPGAQSLSF